MPLDFTLGAYVYASDLAFPLTALRIQVNFQLCLTYTTFMHDCHACHCCKPPEHSAVLQMQLAGTNAGPPALLPCMIPVEPCVKAGR